jgi:hypothetical protein
MAARLLADDGKAAKAGALIEAAWKAQPHPALWLAYRDLKTNETPQGPRPAPGRPGRDEARGARKPHAARRERPDRRRSRRRPRRRPLLDEEPRPRASPA